MRQTEHKRKKPLVVEASIADGTQSVSNQKPVSVNNGAEGSPLGLTKPPVTWEIVLEHTSPMLFIPTVRQIDWL
jgi:hypothetical protein